MPRDRRLRGVSWPLRGATARAKARRAFVRDGSGPDAPDRPSGRARSWPAEPWRPYPAFRGPTPNVAEISCHASVLAAGHSPHPPHAHAEEEILVPIHREVELVLASSDDDPQARIARVEPGAFVYYPAGRHHTIRNPGDSPVAYLMLKWRGLAVTDGDVLGTEIVGFAEASPDLDEPFSTRVVLESPTNSLALLHSHLTVLQPGAGYEPHRDEHDVAIVLLDGAIETLGRRVEALGAVFYAAGELHGLRNPGSDPARYLVFEFHGAGDAHPRSRGRVVSRVASRIRRARERRP